ncbi:MAG: preprotein translocase subunit SecD [halophilic archaeon J07HX5]|nr:MAG: preprotein translocase subunit SecD [halophilic archaeon J07HX5]
MIDPRDNWRILLLVALSLVAAVFLFAPQLDDGDQALNVTGSESTIASPTNLQYGLELSGGTRVRGQLVAQTVENAAIRENESQLISDDIAETLGLEGLDVSVRSTGAETATIEVYANVSEDKIKTALDEAGVDDWDSIQSGVTDNTRSSAVTVIEDRISQAPGISGGSVTETEPLGGGQPFIVVEAPGIDSAQLRELIGEPGRVQIRATSPEIADGNQSFNTQTVIAGNDIEKPVGTAELGSDGRPGLPVTLTASGAEKFVEEMKDLGFTRNEALGSCRLSQAQAGGAPENPGYCLQTVVDNEIIINNSMGSLQADLQGPNPPFIQERSFTMGTSTLSEATQLGINLNSGELPAEYNIQTESFISPGTAQQFRPLALITGLAAWLTVSGVVYFWYRDVRVAVPMLATASAEVFLLLGFAAAIGLPLDLSHIAGFIAVIGTGLDDLIIMADEILQRKKDVTTGRIYQRRFRRAFWVIGIAAATTIIAMSPLAVLSLGDLRGFAIITIVGVLIGVGITRPAYGDILRKLMLDNVKRS